MAGRRTWVIAIALLAVLAPAGLLVAASLVGPDRLRPRIEAVALDQTGRRLSIDGPIRLGWSFHPTVTLSRVRLANLPGGSRPDMATVERIDARLSVSDLLRGRIALASLSLVGPNILLEPVGGVPNWVFRGAGATPQPISATPGLFVHTVHVRNGMVTFHVPQRTNVIGIRLLDVEHPRWTDPLRVDAVLVYRDFQPFLFQASAVPTGDAFAPWITRLQARAFDAILEASGQTSLAGPFDLALSLRTPALEQLNQLLPSMRLPALHGFALSTHLSSTAAGALPVPGRTELSVDSAALDDRMPGLSLSALHLSLPDRGDVATVGTNGRYRGQDFRSEGRFNMPAAWDGRSGNQAEFSVSAARGGSLHPGDTVSLKGQLFLDGGAFAGFDGAVSLHAASLAGLRPLLSPALPPLTDLLLSSNISVSAALDRLQLHALSLRAAEGDLSGEATLRNGAHPSVNATLRSDHLRLDPLLPPAADTNRSGASLLHARLPWASLRGPGALDLDWRAARIAWRGADWPAIALRAVLDRGTLTVEMPDGAVRGRATVRTGADPVPVQVSLRADSFPLLPLAQLAGLRMPADDPVSGSLRFAVALDAHGDTPAALLSSLDGSVAMATSRAGMSYDTLSVVAAPALKQLGARPPAGNHTVVRCFGLRGAVRNGVLTLDRLALDTGSLVLNGVGTVDLNRRTLAMKLQPLARLAGSRVSVPVVLEGSFDAPKATVDADVLGKVGLLLDALLGGDHPRTCQDAGLAPG